MRYLNQGRQATRYALGLVFSVAVACSPNGASEPDDGQDEDLSQDASQDPGEDNSPEDSPDTTQDTDDSSMPEDEPEEDSSKKGTGDDGAGEDKGTTEPKEDSSSDDSKPKATPETKAELCAALKARPVAQVEGKAMVDWWEQFVQEYPGRQFRGKNNGVAAEYLRSQLEDLGYETEILELTHKGRQVRVVQGLMSGTEKPNEYTVIGAHYDHVNATPSGAYDNASGVATVMSICTNLSKAELRRSHACLFFDAEENGLWGSAAWVNRFVKKKSEEIKVVQMYGFDMAGINWPGKAEWPLNGTVGLPKSLRSKLMEPHASTIETVLLQCMGDDIGMKPEGLKVLRYYDKSSDEISFMYGGVPIIRFFGGRKATDYPYYHKSGDTIPGVYKVAGGRENFEMGIEMAIKSSYYTILAFDMLDPFNAKVLK